MEDYFVLRSWLMRQFSLSHPFLFLVVADTRGKQFVSHLIALEKLKNGNHKRPGLEGEERGERGTEERWGSDTIRPRLFGDPWYAVWQRGRRSRHNAGLRPSENTPRFQCQSLSALGHLLAFSFLQNKVFESGSVAPVFTLCLFGGVCVGVWACVRVCVCVCFKTYSLCDFCIYTAKACNICVSLTMSSGQKFKTKTKQRLVYSWPRKRSAQDGAAEMLIGRL